MKLKEYIQTKRIIADGAFGTYYISLYGDGSRAENGAGLSNLPELANIKSAGACYRDPYRIYRGRRTVCPDEYICIKYKESFC